MVYEHELVVINTIDVFFLILLFLFFLKPKSIGLELINQVYQYLKLIESDYFGLEYIDVKGKKVCMQLEFRLT